MDINKSWLCTHRFITQPDSNYYNPTYGFGGANNGLVDSVGGATTSRQVAEYASPYAYPSNHSSIYAGTWYMMAGTNTWTGTSSSPKRNLYYYRNGVSAGSSLSDTWALKYQDRFNQRVFGAAIFPNNGSRTNVALKNIYIFNVALTQAQIQTIYDHDGL